MVTLLDIENAANPAPVAQANLELIDRGVWQRRPSYLGGVPTTNIGSPSSGAHVLHELWTDAAFATWECTSAGTPGSWSQVSPGMGDAFPATPPAGYRFFHTGLRSLFYYTNAPAWFELTIPMAAEGMTGNARSLDAIPTVEAPVGMVRLCWDNGMSTMRHYRLRAGTDAASSPDIIRPSDYDGSTNQKVWEQVTLAGGGGGGGGGGLVGDVDPEGAVTATPGVTYWDKTGIALYVKQTGTGNTGWFKIIG